MSKRNERDFKIILPVAEQAVLDKAAVKMSKQFGGVTMHPFIRGLWADDKGELVKDDNVMFTSSRDLEKFKNPTKTLQKDRKFMRQLANEFGLLLKQDAIWIEEDIIKDVDFIVPQQRRLRSIT